MEKSNKEKIKVVADFWKKDLSPEEIEELYNNSKAPELKSVIFDAVHVYSGEHSDMDLYAINGSTGERYTVRRVVRKWECECIDFHRNRKGETPCKHIIYFMKNG